MGDSSGEIQPHAWRCWRQFGTRSAEPAAARLEPSEGLIDSSGLRRLIERNLPYRNLEVARRCTLSPLTSAASRFASQTGPRSRPYWPARPSRDVSFGADWAPDP